ncbi:hypothetical protein BH10ACI3_BH10ACI3_07100 [soil metagenome]
MKNVKLNIAMLFAIFFAFGVFAGTTKAQCRDAWVGQAINEIVGRQARGSGDTGECNYKNYGGGSWSGYEDLKNKVRASLFAGDPSKTKERCFGAQGSGCDALQVGVFNFKAGRTNLSNGWYRMWISVGSIKHDNCCISNPFGKMCGGNDAAKSLTGNGDGNCVQEWDKAFWNAADGRAWTQDYSPSGVPDLTIVTNPRQTRSQNGTQLVKFETAETRKQSAPPGQALDVGDEAFCSSGRATPYSVPFTVKKWIVCQ